MVTSSPSVLHEANNILAQNDLQLELFIDDKATALFEDILFISQWELLYKRCPWATVFQSHSFIKSWLKLYQDDYTLVVVLLRYEEKISGLLIMAKPHNLTKLVVVGAQTAFYQTWLSDLSLGNKFIINALILLQKKFPGFDINFYNIPPHTPLDWVKEYTERFYINIESNTRSLIDLRVPQISSRLLSKSFRKKFNYLKKQGIVEFEHINDIDRFNNILPTLIDQFDFRKAAKYYEVHYRKNPKRVEFLKILFQEGLLHVTVLKLNGQIIASITDVVDSNGWVYGCEIATHCCAHAKYSPGILSFLLLGQMLVDKGFQIYDLTPGSDSYKTRLANSQDQVYNLQITESYISYVREQVKISVAEMLKLALKHKGASPKFIKDKFNRWQYRLKNLRRVSFINTLLIKLTPKRTAKGTDSGEYLNPDEFSVSNIKSGSLSDLLDYTPNSHDIPQWDFFQNAMKRIELGDIPFTVSLNGQLKFSCWLIKSSSSYNKENNQYNQSLILSEIYCQPDFIPILNKALQIISSKLYTSHQAHKIYIDSDMPIITKHIYSISGT